MTENYELCYACGCRPCVPWCRRVLRGDTKAVAHDASDPIIRAKIEDARAGAWAREDYKQTGGD